MSTCADQGQLLRGVFSAARENRVGAGTTSRRSLLKIYFYAKEEQPDEVLLRPLKANYLPADKGQRLSKLELLEHYTAEPEVYVDKMLPALQKLKRSLANGEKHRELGEYNAAEFEFENALTMDEDNVRATFGLGLTYLDWGQEDKACDVFKKLIRMEAAFEAEHKHLFNEFGIKLRKGGMLDEALTYYAKALNLCSDDEHIYLNIARTLHDKGSPQKASESLRKALELNPAFEEARAFLAYIEKNAPDRLSGNDGSP